MLSITDPNGPGRSPRPTTHATRRSGPRWPAARSTRPAASPGTARPAAAAAAGPPRPDVYRAVGRPVGGKTGTTDDTRSAWFVGITPGPRRGRASSPTRTTPFHVAGDGNSWKPIQAVSGLLRDGLAGTPVRTSHHRRPRPSAPAPHDPFPRANRRPPRARPRARGAWTEERRERQSTGATRERRIEGPRPARAKASARQRSSLPCRVPVPAHAPLDRAGAADGVGRRGDGRARPVAARPVRAPQRDQRPHRRRRQQRQPQRLADVLGPPGAAGGSGPRPAPTRTGPG